MYIMDDFNIDLLKTDMLRPIHYYVECIYSNSMYPLFINQRESQLIVQLHVLLTLFSASILNEFIIFRNDRNKNGGGVLLTLSPLLDPIELTSHHSFPNTSSQSVRASINIANKRWLCGVFYRPKPTDMKALDCLEETLTNLHPERFDGTLLLGDFNVDFALTRDPRRKSYFDKLPAISDIFGLQQLVSDYTRTPNVGSPSMIDLVFTSSAVQLFDVQVTEKLATSDHHMVTFSFRGKSQRSQNLCRTFINMTARMLNS